MRALGFLILVSSFGVRPVCWGVPSGREGISAKYLQFPGEMSDPGATSQKEAFPPSRLKKENKPNPTALGLDAYFSENLQAGCEIKSLDILDAPEKIRS